MPQFEGQYRGDTYAHDVALAVGVGAVVAPTPTKVRPPRTGAAIGSRGTRGPMAALMTVEAFPIRCTFDGVTPPTAANGILYPIGGPYEIIGGFDVTNLQMIGVGGTATVNLAYRGTPQ